MEIRLHALGVALLDAGADKSLKDNRGKTAFDIADEAGHLDVKKVLSGES